MNRISKAWEKRSKKYGKRMEGVLPKSFPLAANKYLDNWMYKSVEEQIKKDKKQKILDLGCGYGRLSKKILEDFPKAKTYGVDVAKTYIDFYNQDLSPRGEAVKADIRKLPYRTSTFDLVFMVTTLMYLTDREDQEKAMNEIFRVLKKDGRFVFIERNTRGYFLITGGGLVEKLRGKKNKEIESVSFSKDCMLRLIKKSGGVVRELRGLPFWTIALPFMFLFKKVFPFTSSLDNKFASFLLPSMYIAYSGKKR